MLFLVTGVSCFIGISIYNISKKFSRFIFNESDSKYLNIVFAGTILIALSQLFGPLFATTYPLICGPDACDYSLSSDWTYIDISYNNSTGNYSFEAKTDSSGLIYDKGETTISIVENIVIYNTITAANSNPLLNYDDQIFLSIETNNADISTSFSRPVIKVDQNSILDIKFVNKPHPGTYQIKVIGESGDGKKCEAIMMVIGISIPIATGTEMIRYTYATVDDYCGSVGTYSGNSTGTTYRFTPTATSSGFKPSNQQLGTSTTIVPLELDIRNEYGNLAPQGTEVTIQDGYGNYVPVTWDASGHALAYGAPGNWKISVRAPGYSDNIHYVVVSSASSSTRSRIYLQKKGFIGEPR